MKSVWSLAGHDPWGAAGLQADLRVGIGCGVNVRTLMTTFTAQNQQRLSLVEALPAPWLEAQWQILRESEEPAALKLGFMPQVDTLRRVGQLLHEVKGVPVICDPVLAPSAAGQPSLHPELRAAYREFIAPHLKLLTPNIPEAEALLDRPLRSAADLEAAAAELRSWGIEAVLIKGGHAEDLIDYFDPGERSYYLKGQRRGGSYRGTGCSLSTAIACFLAQGLSLREAVVAAHSYVQAAIAQSAAAGISLLAPVLEKPELSPLSYTPHFPSQSFPLSDPERLGFYPIVPSLAWLKKLLPTGIGSLQLRIKGAAAEQLRKDINEAAEICRNAGVDLYVNDHWRLAIEAGAYGVHLGQEDLDQLSEADLLSLHTSGLRLGISTHSLEEAARARALHPSYIALGPIFPTTCKSMSFGPQGIARLRDWRRFCPGLPLVAIGGLKLEHAKEVRAAGADSIAVVSAITENAEPEAAALAWLAQIRSGS